MLHVKFETCRCNSFIKKMFEYLFSSVDGRCIEHEAQHIITPAKIIRESGTDKSIVRLPRTSSNFYWASKFFSYLPRKMYKLCRENVRILAFFRQALFTGQVDENSICQALESNLQIICATPHHSLTICKVSASLDQNCRRSYPETNMLKNLITGL